MALNQLSFDLCEKLSTNLKLARRSTNYFITRPLIASKPFTQILDPHFTGKVPEAFIAMIIANLLKGNDWLKWEFAEHQVALAISSHNLASLGWKNGKIL